MILNYYFRDQKVKYETHNNVNVSIMSVFQNEKKIF